MNVVIVTIKGHTEDGEFHHVSFCAHEIELTRAIDPKQILWELYERAKNALSRSENFQQPQPVEFP